MLEKAFAGSLLHTCFLFCQYMPACTASTGHRFLFSGNLAKKKSVSGLPCLDCFAKAIGAKVTPSGEYLQCTLLSFAKSADLDGLVRASRATVFRVRSLIERVTFSPIELMCAVTLATSHVSAYLGWGGLWWKAPLIRRVTRGCWPTTYPSTFSCTDEIADLYEFRDLYWYPSS